MSDFKIEIKNMAEFKKGLSDFAARQVPYALSTALNNTAYGAMLAEKKEMDDALDRPTPFVKRGALYDKATKQRLVSMVRIAGERDRINVARVLGPHIFTGERGRKASETRLRRFGFMGPGQFVTPGPGASLDRFGNISGSEMMKILGAVSAYQEKGYSGKKKPRNANKYYFIQGVGIFKRTGSGSSSPVLFFTNKAPQYEQRFDFYYTAQNYFSRNFISNLRSAWNYALTTAIARGK